MSLTLFIIGIVLFVLLIVLHEFGHFIAAKRNGVEVEEFGIGFPPRIWGKRLFEHKGDKTLYSINLLPIGGFVKLKGEHDADTAENSYGAAPWSAKVKIILAGVAMNFVVAAFILTILSWIGMPKLIENQWSIPSDTKATVEKVLVAYVDPDSPAAESGVEVGDQIIAVEGEVVDDSNELVQLTQQLAGKEVSVKLLDPDGNEKIVKTQLRAEGSEGFLGVAPQDIVFERSTWSAPIRGIGLTLQFSWLTLKGLAGTLTNLIAGNTSEAAEGVAGPIGIVVLLREITAAGPQFLLFFIAIISLTLGVINALPIPALDGGRLFVSWIFRVLKKPLTPEREQLIHGIGMALLLALVVLISIVDVRRFF